MNEEVNIKTFPAIYTGTSLTIGLKQGHEYEISIKKDQQCYIVIASFDFTSNQECDIYCPFSNLKSIQQVWILPEYFSEEYIK